MLEETKVREMIDKLNAQEKELLEKRAKLVNELNNINQTLLALQGSLAMAKTVLEETDGSSANGS